jgi:hypothetical protein
MGRSRDLLRVQACWFRRAGPKKNAIGTNPLVKVLVKGMGILLKGLIRVETSFISAEPRANQEWIREGYHGHNPDHG